MSILAEGKEQSEGAFWSSTNAEILNWVYWQHPTPRLHNAYYLDPVRQWVILQVFKERNSVDRQFQLPICIHVLACSKCSIILSFISQLFWSQLIKQAPKEKNTVRWGLEVWFWSSDGQKTSRRQKGFQVMFVTLHTHTHTEMYMTHTVHL